ncbi:MAG: biotin/lipoyl-binding protein [Ktedonobacteraceae bacterium]|nr:biotin/lipoyl-binding protein [Ktedonobacteraceae bacterium]
MSYIAVVGKQTYRIDAHRDEQQRSVTLDGTTYTIDWRAIAPVVGNEGAGHYSLLIAGTSYDIFINKLVEKRTYEISFAGQRFEVKIEDERSKLLTELVKSGASADEAAVYAPMPGLVIDVPVEQGAAVTAGQTLVVLEAMKMENDLSSPIAGTIQKIRVTKGQTVEEGEVLVVVTKRV